MSEIQLTPTEFAGLDPQPLELIRRLLDPQPEQDEGVWYWRGTFFDWEAFNVGNSPSIRCPLGEAGDSLRVLEEWWSDDEDGCHYKASEYPASWWERVGDRCMESPAMRAMDEPEWNPPETMPPWASRYVLKIISVGVEFHYHAWNWIIEVRSES